MSEASEPYRVCVVCWGNICRSPMGEFLLREAFADAGLADRVVVELSPYDLTRGRIVYRHK